MHLKKQCVRTLTGFYVARLGRVNLKLSLSTRSRRIVGLKA